MEDTVHVYEQNGIKVNAERDGPTAAPDTAAESDVNGMIRSLIDNVDHTVAVEVLHGN
jgi:hypothetical protein